MRRRGTTRSRRWPAFVIGLLCGVVLLWTLLEYRASLWPWLPAPGVKPAAVPLDAPAVINDTADADARWQEDANTRRPLPLPPSAPTPELPTAPPPPSPTQPEAERVDEPRPAADAPTTTAAPPSLLLPVAGVSAGQLQDTYADARGQGRQHDAIDIMAPTGTPVLAVADGTIVKLFNSKPGGLTIYQFDSRAEHAFYYAHLERYAEGLHEGQRVARGDLIGHVGYSGNANPAAPHLHFAIFLLGPEKNWWQGTAINPYPALGGR